MTKRAVDIVEVEPFGAGAANQRFQPVEQAPVNGPKREKRLVVVRNFLANLSELLAGACAGLVVRDELPGRRT
jgi:hypothetical protein